MRRMSFMRETQVQKRQENAMRMIPSARLKAMRPVSTGYTFPSLVVSSSGMNL
jgi:hypothetical protein